jgi:hypothetical protein
MYEGYYVFMNGRMQIPHLGQLIDSVLDERIEYLEQVGPICEEDDIYILIDNVPFNEILVDPSFPEVNLQLVKAKVEREIGNPELARNQDENLDINVEKSLVNAEDVVTATIEPDLGVGNEQVKFVIAFESNFVHAHAIAYAGGDT